MFTTRYVQQVGDQLRSAGSLGDERTREIAGALSEASASAVRLAILGAVSEVAEEINGALADAAAPHQGPAVSVTLDGEAVRINVTTPPEDVDAPPPADDTDASARISLRLSESLKADIERAAADADLSVNTWLVRLAAAATRERTAPGWAGGWPGTDWPGADWPGRRSGHGPGRRGSNRTNGWVTG
jgi:HicB family